jgi:hypothetical protein
VRRSRRAGASRSGRTPRPVGNDGGLSRGRTASAGTRESATRTLRLRTGVGVAAARGIGSRPIPRGPAAHPVQACPHAEDGSDRATQSATTSVVSGCGALPPRAAMDVAAGDGELTTIEVSVGTQAQGSIGRRGAATRSAATSSSVEQSHGAARPADAVWRHTARRRIEVARWQGSR